MSSLTASDIMVPNPVTIEPSASVEEAAKIMAARDVSSLVVIDRERRVVGIVTARDIVDKVVARGLNPSELKVSDIMAKPVTIVEPNTPIKDVVLLMSSTGHRHIPVVGEGGILMGIVSEFDILKLVPDLLESVEVGRGGGRRAEEV